MENYFIFFAYVVGTAFGYYWGKKDEDTGRTIGNFRKLTFLRTLLNMMCQAMGVQIFVINYVFPNFGLINKTI